MYLLVVELQRVFDPEVHDKGEVETKKLEHAFRKLMDLSEWISHSSSGHLVFERVVAPEQNDMASEIGELTFPARVHSANDRRKGDSVAMSTELSSLLAVYDGMGDRLSSQKGRNKGVRCDVVFAPSGAADPVA